MEREYLSTTAVESRAGGAKASPLASRSFSPALDEHQQRPRPNHATSAHGHFGHGWSGYRRSVLTSTATNSRSFGIGPFIPIGACSISLAHRRPARFLSSRRVGHNSRAGAVIAAARLSHSRAWIGCRRSLVQSLPHQPHIQAIADRLHHHDLSCLPSPDGFKTIGKDLIHGAKALSPRGKTYD